MTINRSLTCGTEQKLTVKQTKSIAIIVAAGSIEAGCREAKVAKSAFYGWLRTNTTFRVEFQKAQKLLVEGAFERLRFAVPLAVDTLVDLLNHDNGHVRLRAACALLEHGLNAEEKHQAGRVADRPHELPPHVQEMMRFVVTRGREAGGTGSTGDEG
jgi:hypothetical protein